jgi:mono/diheme cytochrome c family protein
MASPRPDPLRRVDRVLAPLTWVAAVLTAALLFLGPELIGAKKARATAAASSGEAVFMDAGCAGCHALAAAGSSGGAGPDLDALRPDAATVEAAVRSGRGSMPAFEGRLYDSEIVAVARYVADSAGR